MHSVYSLVLEKELVVFGDSHQEQDCGDILKTMYPFLALRSLSSYVEHAVGEVLDDEGGFRNACGLDTGSEHILVIGYVVMGCDALDRIKVAGQTRQFCSSVAAKPIEAAR